MLSDESEYKVLFQISPIQGILKSGQTETFAVQLTIPPEVEQLSHWPLPEAGSVISVEKVKVILQTTLVFEGSTWLGSLALGWVQVPSGSWPAGRAQ